ncbi:MAG TPA: hypothetical protein PKE04_13085 [Clostridia bacterium]|nr:hypothetical protein [Clostridia bacterium]
MPELLEIWLYMLTILLMLGAGLILHLFIHELGHLLFGLATGYGFVYFYFFAWVLTRTGGRLFLDKLRLEGVQGQCMMVPSDRFQPEKHPVVPYNLGGSMANLIVVGITYAAWLLSSRGLWFTGLCLGFGGAGLCVCLINVIPQWNRGIPNDGYNLWAICKSGAARICFIHQLKITHALVEGIPLGRMPSSWFETPEGADWSNPHCAATGYAQAMRGLEAMDFQNTRARVDWLLEHAKGLARIHRMELQAERLFLSLLLREDRSEPAGAEWTRIYTEELRGYLQRNGRSLPHKRHLYALARLADQDPEQARKCRDDFEALAGSSPHPEQVRTYRALMDQVDALYDRQMKSAAHGPDEAPRCDAR